MNPGALPSLADPAALWDLFQALPFGVVVADAAGRILEANPAAETLLGLTREASSGRDIASPAWDVVRLDASPMPPEEFASVRALREGKVIRDVEMGLARPDGGRVWLNVTAAPTEGGRVVITFQDIGPRVRDAAVRRAHMRLNALPEEGGLEGLLGATLDDLELLTGSRIGFYHLVDPDGETFHLQAWSASTKAEFCRAEGHGSHFPVSQAGMWADALRQARPVIHNDCALEPGRKPLPPGQVEPIRELVVPVIRQGRIKALAGVGNKPGPYTAEDIATVQRLANHAWEVAGRWKAKEEHRRSEDLMERTFAHSPQGMALVSLEGRYLKVNLALCGILGRTEEELLGLSIREITYPEDWNQDQEGIADLLSGRKIAVQLEKRYVHKAGQVVWAQLTVSLLRDDQGRPLQFVAQIRDMGERHRSERERALTLRVLQILNETEDPEIAAALLLHEVRDSLGIEAGAIRLAQRDDFTYAAHEGFPQAFVDAENCLRSRSVQGEPLFDGQGRPLFDCTCGLVLMGRTDPSNPLFTPGGSAWTLDAQPRRNVSLEPDPRQAPRDHCVHSGYRSIALVPIRSTEGIVGMLQLNDSRPNCFDLQGVIFLEGIASSVGMAIERKRMEQALEASEARFRHISETAEEWIWEVDANGLYTFSSPVAESLLGYAPGDLVGRLHFYDLWPPGDREAFLPAVLNLFGRHEAIRDLPNTVMRKDGTLLRVETTGVPVLDPRGRLLGYRGVDRNITQREAASAERHLMERELNHLFRIESLGRMASGISHDMNNVLGAILAVGSVLQTRHAADPEIVKDTETLLQAALRGRDLVKGLRDFSRKELESSTDLDLNELARREADLLERTTLKRVEVRLDLAPGLPPVFGDGSAILNALMNLCSNAVDAMPKGGQLTLITRDLGQGFVELAVQDNGEGMSPDVRSRALEPFFTTKAMGKGTGLGLSQVYGTLKAHGGTVDIQSQIGQGTRVSLAFPAAITRAPQEPEALPDAAVARRNLAILLVDDEDLIRGSVKVLLEALGHRVQDACSGLEALRRLKGGQEVDLVILDLNMPVLDGEETLDRLRLQRPGLPVLLATGYADDRVPAILKRFPQVRILRKPFTIQEMEKLLAVWPLPRDGAHPGASGR